MPPKGKKKDPNGMILVPEDTFLRARKLCDLKVAPKQPKGELTREDWCIPATFHSASPELKQTIYYFQECSIVHFQERDQMKVPSRIKAVTDDNKSPKKPHTRKELGELLKYMKSSVKQATKRTGQFLKQLQKKEKISTKREDKLKQIKEVGDQMNEELRTARSFVEKRELFEKKYMVGSKLGDKAPRKNALIVLEVSDRQGAWVDETKDEVMKLLNGVIEEGQTESLNLAIFSAGGVTAWCPQFQSKTDPKKGLADAIKWLNKNFSAKSCAAQAFPPDWMGMLNKFVATDGGPSALPWRIFICCSKTPEGARQDILTLLKEQREKDPPAKGEPVLPINLVAFDPSIAEDAEEKAVLDEIAGPNGSALIDTSAQDLLDLDGRLKAVQSKKKQLDKLNKQLEKIPDVSEDLTENRACLQMQVALQRMLENDFEILDWAIKNDLELPEPEI